MKQARVTISRYQGSSGTGITLKVDDEASNLNVVTVQMTLEDFGALVTGQGHLPAAVEHWIGDRSSNIGKQREVKHVDIERPVTDGREERNAEIRARPEVAALLAAGWILSSDGQDRQQHGPKWGVTLVRYAEAGQ